MKRAEFGDQGLAYKPQGHGVRKWQVLIRQGIADSAVTLPIDPRIVKGCRRGLG